MTTPQVDITVGSAVEVATRDLPAAAIREIMAGLSLPNPAHQAAEKRGAYGGPSVPSTLCYVETTGEALRLPRGALPLLRRVAAEHGLQLRVRDVRVTPVERLDAFPAVPLRGYQRCAVQELMRWQQGVFRLPAGAGKTRAAIGAIAEIRTPTLILVASLDLARQWCGQIVEHLGRVPGLVGGGECVVQTVTVATVQTLARWTTAKLDGFLARFGLLVIDEAHHLASPTFRKVVGRCPAKYRLALTATPEREDGLTPVLEWFCGPVLASVAHAELIDDGALVAPQVRELRTQFSFDYRGPDDWPRLLEQIPRDEARNDLIVDAVAAEVQQGASVLVLTGRVEHAELLASLLSGRGVGAEAMTGATRKRDRTRILEAARAGDLPVLVATTLADEGLDVPLLSRVFLVFPARAAGRVEQRIGRVMRPHPSKHDAVIFDVVDAQVGVLRHQARKRREVFSRVLGGPGSKRAA